MQIGLLRALDTWLSEDQARVEQRLVAREAAAALVQQFARACRAADPAAVAAMPQMLDILKQMLGRCGWRMEEGGAVCRACVERVQGGGISGPVLMEGVGACAEHVRRSRTRAGGVHLSHPPSCPHQQVQQAGGGDGHGRPGAPLAGAAHQWPCQRAHPAR